MADANNKDERIDTTTPAQEDERPALADGYTLNAVRNESRTDDARLAFSSESELDSADTRFESTEQSLPSVAWQEDADSASPDRPDSLPYGAAAPANGYSNGHTNGHALKSQVKEKAGEVMHKAGESLKSQLGSQKEKAADGLGSLTQAFHQTGDSLRESGQSQVGQYAESFASQMDRFTNYLREKDIDEITHEVSDYARKNPAVFLGGAFLVGVAISRFLKSSGSAATSAAMASPPPIPAQGYATSGYSSQGYKGGSTSDTGSSSSSSVQDLSA